MDAVSVIVYAFIAGITSGVTETAKTAIADSYQTFKSLLLAKVSNSPETQAAIKLLERKPESEERQAVLREELTEIEIEKDTELIVLAQKILDQINQPGAKPGKYVISIQNAQGTVIGDDSNVRQIFESAKKK